MHSGQILQCRTEKTQAFQRKSYRGLNNHWIGLKLIVSLSHESVLSFGLQFVVESMSVAPGANLDICYRFCQFVVSLEYNSVDYFARKDSFPDPQSMSPSTMYSLGSQLGPTSPLYRSIWLKYTLTWGRRKREILHLLKGSENLRTVELFDRCRRYSGHPCQNTHGCPCQPLMAS
jgi:hypothetical protein